MTQSDLVHVVDDDLSVREALSSLLRSVGLAVRTYPSAADFLDAPRGSPAWPAWSSTCACPG